MDSIRNRRVRHPVSAISAAFCTLSLLACSASAAQTSPDNATAATQPALALERISAEDFGALPFMQAPRLSPSGTRVAARVHVRGELKIAVVDLGSKTQVSSAIPIPEQRDLLWYRWAGDNRLLLSLGKSQRLRGEDEYATRLMMIDLATGKAHFIGKRTEGLQGDDVLYVDPDGRSLLLSIQETVFEYPSVWSVDLDTIRMKRVVKARAGVWEWFADNSGIVRAGIGVSGKSWWLLYRKDENGHFEKVIRRKTTKDEQNGDVERFILIGGSDQGYVVANKATGRYALYRYDFANDSMGEPIFEHPEVDIDDVGVTEGGVVEALYYIDDRRRIEWFDPTMKEIQAAIDEALPDRINRVISVSRDRGRMLVWTGGASDPGLIYAFDPSAGRMRLLAKPYDRINADALAKMESTSYPARDGLKIPAYLTVPREREAKALPLIVMPHGGPFARDEWSYDPWVQFLANRGYVVLQPNFRGSTGYGKAFVEKGMGQWGRGMQDDIDDGVKWLVDQGQVDPKRVCIMGTSFGGYAAMWAATRNPDIYRCAISFAGISDVDAMLRYDRKSFSASRYYRSWREIVQGEKNFDLDSVSPLFAADRIEVPLLIAHGSRDENVPPSQSKKLHDALTTAKKAHEFIMYEGEGHGFQDPVNAVDFLKRVEAFLDTHNPADRVVAGTQ